MSTITAIQQTSPASIALFGTGAIGSRLGALLAARTDHLLRYGSRRPEQTAGKVLASVGAADPERVKVVGYAEAASFGEIVILATPWWEDATAHALAAAGPLTGKIIVDATNVLNADWSPAEVPGGVLRC